MKIKEISKICGKANQVVVIDTETQWAGTGAAIYALHKFPEITEECAAAAFDIDESLSPSITVKNEPLFDVSDYCGSEIELQKFDFPIAKVFGSQPFYTGDRLIYIDSKYLKPISDVGDENIKYCLRKTAQGTDYVVVKYGLIALAAIFTLQIDIDKAIDETEYFLSILKQTEKKTPWQ